MKETKQELNFQSTLSTTSIDDLDLVIKEAKAKKLIERRECTQFTYLYTPKGEKVRSSSFIVE